jgi:hypothetical protein
VVLHRFWIEFDSDQAPLSMQLGCGVTAYDREDAMRLVADTLGSKPPQPLRITEDVDVSTLDAGHVLPNMHAPNVRGIWFPM